MIETGFLLIGIFLGAVIGWLFARMKLEAERTARAIAETRLEEAKRGIEEQKRLLDEAKELEIELNLYASDAVNLAPAIIYSIDMITEDKHLLRKSVKKFARKHGVNILTLKEYYS